MRFHIFVVIIFMFTAGSASAAPASSSKEGYAVRLFGGTSKADPKELNTELEAQGVKKLDSLLDLGIEGTVYTNGFLSLGVRYVHRVTLLPEATETSLTSYSATLRQDTLVGTARYRLMGSDFHRFDILIGAGGSTTRMTTDFSHGEGEWSGDVATGSPYAIGGASFAIGYKSFFIFAEGGYAYNKLAAIKREGSASANVGNIDLSGYYGVAGIIFYVESIAKFINK